MGKMRPVVTRPPLIVLTKVRVMVIVMVNSDGNGIGSVNRIFQTKKNDLHL